VTAAERERERDLRAEVASAQLDLRLLRAGIDVDGVRQRRARQKARLTRAHRILRRGPWCWGDATRITLR
jgi:hypothetical protein